MIHRAVLGSVERMIAILIEHYAGKWPFFLSPRHATVVPVSKQFEAYAASVQKRVRAAVSTAPARMHARLHASTPLLHS